MAKRDPDLRLFIKVRKNGDVVPGFTILRKKKPKQGYWLEIASNTCCGTTSSTTTTTTTI